MSSPEDRTASQPTDAQPTVPQPTLPQPELRQQAFPQPVPPQSYASPPRTTPPTALGQTNAFALVSAILAFIQPIAAVVFGHLALGQIKRTGDGGRGLALTGLIIGYVYLSFLVMFVIFYVGLLMLVFGSMGAFISEIGDPTRIPDFDSGF